MLPIIIIMDSRTDANAINRSKQKKKSASRAGAAYPHAMRRPAGGQITTR